jgi:LacI family transcriptional regulator
MISIISPTIGDEFHERLISAIDEVLSNKGYDIVFFPLFSRDRLQRVSNPSHFLYQTDGLIVSSLSLTKMFKDNKLPTNKPYILVDTRDEMNDCIFVDNYYGGILAAQNIKIYKNSDIYILGGYESDEVFTSGVFLERMNGFIDELVNQKGVPKEKIKVIEVPLSWKESFKISKTIIKSEKKKFSVFALSDIIAFGFIEGAKYLNIFPGKDYSIIGYDDLSFAETIKLSTVSQPIELLGQTAAELLIEKIANHSDEKIQKCLKPIYIERESN